MNACPHGGNPMESRGSYTTSADGRQDPREMRLWDPLDGVFWWMDGRFKSRPNDALRKKASRLVEAGNPWEIPARLECG